MIRTLLLSTVAAVALTGAASAADLPVRSAPPAPVYAVPMFSWAGFYIGGQVGYGWGDARWTSVTGASLFTDRNPGDAFNTKPKGWLAGAQAGYNWQFGSLVVGLEGSYAAAGMKSSALSNFNASDDVYTTRINSIGTVSARLGYAIDRTLLYVKGGYAGADIKTSIVDVVPASLGSVSKSKWESGYVLGAGVEYAFTNNWTAGLEYNYLDFGRSNRTYVSGDVDRVKVNAHTVALRLNYKFGGPSAVVAKY